MKKRYLKRVVSIMLSAAMIFTAVLPAAAAGTDSGDSSQDADYIWTLGYENNINGPSDGEQGTNGWYFMYTEETDKEEGEAFASDGIKECTWADKGSMQLKSEAENAPYESMWVPANYLQEGLTGAALYKPDADNPNGTFNNWVMTSNGTLNPDVESTAVTGIYAWKAPEAGTYNFDVAYAAGGNHCDLNGARYYYYKDYFFKDGTDDKKIPEQREGGVAVSVNTKDSQLAYAKCISMTEEHDYLYSGSFSGSVELEKDAMVYFTVDPREYGTYDMANFQITVTKGECGEWSAPTYSWDGYGVCTASRTCENHKGDHVRSTTVEGKLKETIKAATCEEDGQAEFEAVFDDQSLETQTAVQAIKASGHDYVNAYDDHYAGKSQFEWADDYSYCIWKAPCTHCGQYGEVEKSTNIICEPGTEGGATCTQGGTCTYTASFYWGYVWSGKVEATTDNPLPHDYSKGNYEWAEDMSTCTKHYLCKRCGVENEDLVATVDTEKKAPNCTEDGVYIAQFDWGWDWQMQPTGEKALGHDTTDASYEWTDDYTLCTKSFTCSRCEETVEEADGTITEPTCTEDGFATASFKGEAEPQTVVIPKLGHDYETKYEWAADKSTCTKYEVCTRCKEETEKVTVDTEKTEPTCTEAGKYTASFDNGADVQTSNIPALGHDWGQWTTVSAATTNAAEIQKRVCNRCKAAETQKVGSVLPQKVTGISISGISKKIAAGKKIQLTAKIKPAKAANKAVTWKSSNKKYATVDSKGKVTIKKAGKGHTVIISATAKDGSKVKANYKIKIMKNSVKSISLKAAKKTVKAGKATTVKATVKTTGKSSVNKTLKWTSSNTKYATANSKGKVTTKKAGKGHKVKITAKATDGSGKKKTVTIKIK